MERAHDGPPKGIYHPLETISNYALFLREDNEGLDEASVRHLDRIEKLIARMYTLIDGMLVLSRLGRARQARGQRDIGGVVVLAAYALQVLDAYVSAELADFDVSEDLSLRIVPEPAAPGLGLRIRL